MDETWHENLFGSTRHRLDDELTAVVVGADLWATPGDQWTPAQRAAFVEQLPSGLLGLYLFASSDFRDRVGRVRAARDPEAATFAEAGAYVRKGLGRAVIARYLVLAASASDNLDMLRILGGLGRTSVQKAAPLQPGQPRRARAYDYDHAARLVVKRGEQVCLGENCTTRLTTTPARSAARRVRRDYCDACAKRSALVAERDKKAIKRILDDAAAAVLPEAGSRQRSRRLQRAQS